MFYSKTGQRAAYSETFNEDALADQFEGGDLFHDTVIGDFIEIDSVLGFILDLALGPLLLLCCLAARRRCCFCFGLVNEN